jgi:hypothetical protein
MDIEPPAPECPADGDIGTALLAEPVHPTAEAIWEKMHRSLREAARTFPFVLCVREDKLASLFKVSAQQVRWALRWNANLCVTDTQQPGVVAIHIRDEPPPQHPHSPPSMMVSSPPPPWMPWSNNGLPWMHAPPPPADDRVE